VTAIIALMRRSFAFLLLFLIACRAFTPAGFKPNSGDSGSPTDDAPSGSETVSPAPNNDSPGTTPVSPTQVAKTEQLETFQEDDFKVVFHPDGPLYAGDLVSVEVIAPQNANLDERRVQVVIGNTVGAQEIEAAFGPYGIGGRNQATMLWVWDTSRLSPGEFDLIFRITPDGPNWTETVSLNPAVDIPPPEPEAAWASGESDCCLVYYITGTEAEREILTLLDIVDQQFRSASQHLPAELDAPVEITFLPRVLGHGGFARQDIAISYLDRNYAGSGTVTVLHHELVHMMDGLLGGGLRPTMLVEGLAVYLTGGHFKPEPLMERAAALLRPEPGCEEKIPEDGRCGLGWYIPLSTLVDNFYFEQHEIGYMQAGALVEFMVETWGWEAFSDFYRDIQPVPSATDLVYDDQSEEPPEGSPEILSLNMALQEHFELDLERLEGLFQDALGQEELSAFWVDDVRLTREYYDAVRRYQSILDPSAYFLTAWLPDNAQMRARGVVADYLRRPSLAENIALETMLVSVDDGLRTGDHARASQTLAAVSAALDVYAGQADNSRALSAHPMAADYLSLVEVLVDMGFRPDRILINNKEARVWVHGAGPQQIELYLVKRTENWGLAYAAPQKWGHPMVCKAGTEPITWTSVGICQ